ncbi:GNAT family N-acetyltransferase [Frankia sp. Cas3]|uniref:GNAT family N-acetyltransferase n=1 Tax=Frankia sp. Cas3 TaxID=3073926 RepID=UPI002AD3FC17|nr:GNAT family N-acetyltransferase [Frankia sp. Cas3]
MTDEIREILPPHTGSAFLAMAALRPALRDEATFVRLVDDVQRAEGYRLVGVFEPAGAAARAVAGFRVGHALSFGRYLYVDDLSTLGDVRRRGYGGRLLEWLFTEARRLGCDQVRLDSGVGPTRTDAHRLYMNTGMAIAAHHFTHVLDG